MSNIFILSLPRSGSSMLANLISNSGYKNYISSGSDLLSSSPRNVDGYFEDIKLILLNDQLIRMLYGKRYSFLFPPTIESRLKKKFLNKNINFKHDINEETLFIPTDFLKNLKNYTNHDWDIWGLTRMSYGEKWYKCYEKYGVNSYTGILNEKVNFEKKISNSKFMVVKDPRLLLLLEHYNIDFDKNKFIIIKRDKLSNKSSMRSHYSNNLFSRKKLPNTSFVTNHFNFKAGYLSYNEYLKRYNFLINKNFRLNSLTISYEDVVSKKLNTIRSIEDFINRKINLSLIK